MEAIMDSEEFIHVNRVQGIPPQPGHGMFEPDRDQHQPPEDRKHRFRRSKDYIHTLQAATEASNEQLVRLGIPLRFCVYEAHGQLMIDVVRLDENGHIIAAVRKDITNEDFEKWIEDIAGMEGLLFDRAG